MNRPKRPTTQLMKLREIFTKQQLGTKPKDTKILGLLWDKMKNFFII